jgi:hypothetical protein
MTEMLTTGNPLWKGQRGQPLPVFSTEDSPLRIAIMNRLSSVALSAALAVVGVGASVSAQAHPYLAAGIGCPTGAIAERAGYVRPYFAPFYAHGPYWQREFERQRLERFWREHGERRW